MRFEFPPCTEWVPRCRHLVLAHARERGVPPAAEGVIALLTTELVSNAVRYGPRDTPIEISARRAGDAYDVVVTDHWVEGPEVRDPGPTALGGRGLRLVESLATAWGVRRHAADGKSVWFTVAVGT